MDTIFKPILITIWLMALIYCSIPTKEDLIKHYNDIYSKEPIEDNIKKYSTFLLFNAILIIIYGVIHIISNSNGNDLIIDTLLSATGLILCLAAYGIWNKYSWARSMTPLLLILITILVISATHLNYNFDNFLIISSENIHINLQPISDFAIFFIKIGYFVIFDIFC